jgi:hypothetical protein
MRALITALLLAASSAATAATIANSYSVISHTGDGMSAVGDVLTVHGFGIVNNHAINSTEQLTWGALLEFTPNPGLSITGYDLTVSASFFWEKNANFDFVATGSFEVLDGPRADFTADGMAGQTAPVLLHHTIVGSVFDLRYVMTAHGQNDFCLPGSDTIACGNGMGIGWVAAGLVLNHITVNPVLVPVPEPATWLLLALGIPLLAVSRRSSRGQSTASSAHTKRLLVS